VKLTVAGILDCFKADGFRTARGWIKGLKASLDFGGVSSIILVRVGRTGRSAPRGLLMMREELSARWPTCLTFATLGAAMFAMVTAMVTVRIARRRFAYVSSFR
jgi:hypothetical protein